MSRVTASDTTTFPVYTGKVTGAPSCMRTFSEALRGRNWQRWIEALWQLSNTDVDPWVDDAANLMADADMVQRIGSIDAVFTAYATKAAAMVDAREAARSRNWAVAAHFLNRLANTNCATWTDDTVRGDP